MSILNRKILGVLLMSLGCAAQLQAQSFQRLSPKTPMKEPQEGTPATSAPVKEPKGAADPSAPKLKGVVIVKSREEVQAKGDVTVSGLRVGPGQELDTIRNADFERLIGGYIGKPIDERNINRLQSDIILFYRKSGHPLVDVVYPSQESVGSGVLQIFILEAKLGRIVVEGNKYFDTNTFVSEIRLRPNEPVDADKLSEDVDWLNQNPGHTVNAAFKPGEKLGESDLVLRVEDRRPLRGFLGYENSGPRAAGEDRLFAGFNWFDALGLDQRFSYQFTTDTDFEFIKAHSITYDIPLPWRHTLSLYGGYVDSKADLPAPGPLTLKGSSYQISFRYQVPLPRMGGYTHDVSAGLDWKQFNNDFEFGGTKFAATKVDVVQIAVNYRGSESDRYGRTTFGTEAYFSPGGLTSDNNDTAFAALRTSSKAQYWYSKLTAQRETPLPDGFSWVVRGAAQVADHNLQSSEQFGLGGYSTVRGYREREANGDLGLFISNEIYTPQWPLLDAMSAGVKDRIQLLGFFDYGRTYLKQVTLAGEAANTTLMSAGVGLRYSIRSNLAVRFDWGWQLRASGDPNGRNDQGHVALVLSY